MFTIMYILMMAKGVYYVKPLAEFDDYQYCVQIARELGRAVPDLVVECVEYRDV